MSVSFNHMRKNSMISMNYRIKETNSSAHITDGGAQSCFGAKPSRSNNGAGSLFKSRGAGIED